jgi:hypothetical protein
VDTGGDTQIARLAARLVLAATLGVMAAVHLDLYSAYDYRAIKTIGVLFLLNGIFGSLLCLVVLFVPGRWLSLAGLAAAGLEAGTLAGFIVALNTPLFGFQDSIHAPHGWLALIDEIVGTVVALGLFAAAVRVRVAQRARA